MHGQPDHDETLPWVTSTMEGMGRSGDMDYDGGTYFRMDRTTYYLLLHHAEYGEVFLLYSCQYSKNFLMNRLYLAGKR